MQNEAMKYLTPFRQLLTLALYCAVFFLVFQVISALVRWLAS